MQSLSRQAHTTTTPEELQQAITANTTAINALVTQFIQPNTQQHVASMQRLDRIEQLLERHAEVIAGIDIKLDSAASLLQDTIRQQQAKAQQIAQHAEGITELRTLSRENQQNLQIFIDEGRADRQAQREALRAIMSVSSRVDRLEQAS